MSKKITKVSVNKFEKIIPALVPFSLVCGSGDDSFLIEVKPRLSLTESISFVSSVVGAVIDETATYAVKDFAIRTNTIEFYSNLRLPENPEHQYDLVYGTDIVDRIVSNINFNCDAYDFLLESVEDQLKFESEKIQSQFKSETAAFIAKIESECEQIMKIVTTFTDVFKDIEPTQMGKILAKIPEMESITEIGLAKAVLDIQNNKIEGDEEDS